MNGYFKVVGEIKEMQEMQDVLTTKHQNPERKGAHFNIYHFIFMCADQREKYQQNSQGKIGAEKL